MFAELCNISKCVIRTSWRPLAVLQCTEGNLDVEVTPLCQLLSQAWLPNSHPALGRSQRLSQRRTTKLPRFCGASLGASLALCLTLSCHDRRFLVVFRHLQTILAKIVHEATTPSAPWQSTLWPKSWRCTMEASWPSTSRADMC